MPLAQKLLDETKQHKIRVVYMPRKVASWWNQNSREDGEPQQFCGFYWINGKEEGGPFRSQSAAWRDAWYRVVLGQTPPDVDMLFKRNTKR